MKNFLMHAVLEAEQLPARIANLDTSLANVDADSPFQFVP